MAHDHPLKKPFLGSLRASRAIKFFFIGLVIGLEHKGRPCKMRDSVQQKLGHTKTYVCSLVLI